MNYSMTRVSKNIKTGPIPVTYSNKNTCPDNCSLKYDAIDKTKPGPCYAMGGHVNIHFNKLTTGERGYNYQDLILEVESIRRGALWRHNVSGDLLNSPLDKETIDFKALVQLIKANKGKRGFTYTHYKLNLQNRAAIDYSNQQGFTINISTETIDQAVKSFKAGRPTVTLIPEDAPKVTRTKEGINIVRCPATNDTKTNIDCNQCELCQDQDRAYIIGFPVHGVKKRSLGHRINVLNIQTEAA